MRDGRGVTARGLAALAALLAAAALAAACVPPGSMPDNSYVSMTPATATAPPADAGQATVLRVIDGDTLDVRFPGGAVERVRLVHVDTPELGEPPQCYGPEAARFVLALLSANPSVRLERDYTDRDTHGRLLRYVRLADGSLLSERLAKAGMARFWLYRPGTDTRYANRVEAAANEAESAGRGLWGVC